MLQKNLDNTYFITYSNYLELENKVFAFRKQQLFDITNLPILQHLKDNNKCDGYWINRKWFPLSKLESFVKKENKTVDVSNLQWYEQLHLDYVFNLKMEP